MRKIKNPGEVPWRTEIVEHQLHIGDLPFEGILGELVFEDHPEEIRDLSRLIGEDDCGSNFSGADDSVGADFHSISIEEIEELLHSGWAD